jgi:predicted glycosyltransferase involved in capsule biosynthesis
MKELSIIVSVLESYEVVRRQLLHFQRILPRECELIMVDDGSEPSLQAVCDSISISFAFKLHFTHDHRPWTQPKGRNIGASFSCAPKLLFFDIDHILTSDIIQACLRYEGDKLHWLRRPGILDERGCIVTDPVVLLEYGLTDNFVSVHANSFMIRQPLFKQLGGYDERFCGRYGGDDIDFNDRYQRMCQGGRARPEEVIGEGYVFPNPSADVKRVFHSLRFG